jgi:Family of unknown function (DUF6264)
VSADGERPQYGEYATPEQQQERIRLSGGVPTPAGAPTTAGAPTPAGAPVPVVPVDSDPATWAAPKTDSAVSAPPRRTVDRVVTIALLAYGLFTVAVTVPQLLDFASFAQTWMEMAGIEGEFSNLAQGRVWGGVAALLFAGGWVVTALLSWRSLARRRISWWIPLVGAVVTIVVVSVCLTVPILSDPAIMEQFSGL